MGRRNRPYEGSGPTPQPGDIPGRARNAGTPCSHCQDTHSASQECGLVTSSRREGRREKDGRKTEDPPHPLLSVDLFRNTLLLEQLTDGDRLGTLPHTKEEENADAARRAFGLIVSSSCQGAQANSRRGAPPFGCFSLFIKNETNIRFKRRPWRQKCEHSEHDDEICSAIHFRMAFHCLMQ